MISKIGETNELSLTDVPHHYLQKEWREAKTQAEPGCLPVREDRAGSLGRPSCSESQSLGAQHRENSRGPTEGAESQAENSLCVCVRVGQQTSQSSRSNPHRSPGARNSPSSHRQKPSNSQGISGVPRRALLHRQERAGPGPAAQVPFNETYKQPQKDKNKSYTREVLITCLQNWRTHFKN